MRKILTLAAVLALAACGGGGGGSTPVSNPQPVATTAPQSNYVTPQFVLVVPARGSSATSRTPQYVSSGTASVKITLTSDSVGIPPGSIAPATTDISPTCAAGGCTVTVNGPPSPPGTDSWLIVTYSGAGATLSALNAAQLNTVTVTAGTANTQTVTLGAIPATLTISGVPAALNAGFQATPQTATVSVIAKDGAGVTIPTGRTPAVLYVDATGTAINITLSDPDTNANGSCLIASGTSTCTSAAASSVTFSGPDVTKVFSYNGLAENPYSLTASASTATSATAAFQPALSAPVFNGTPATPTGVALAGSPEIDLFAASGVGSTGTEYFTEVGWTESPYNKALTFANTGACTTGTGITAASMADIAGIAAGTNSPTNGTPFTATIASGTGLPKPGSCPSKISDGLSSNTTDGSKTLTVTYTSLSITGQSKRRQ